LKTHQKSARQVGQIRRPMKFSTRESIRVALSETNTDLPLTAGWALSRLVAWALFDQHESKRIPKQHRKTRAAKRLFIPTYAYKAGQLYLLYHAAPFFRKETARFRKLIKMFFETGQITKNFGLRGRTLSSLHNDKKGAAI
jgi:GR25 family glycosyltransferase involved in LPS biosynthesis